MDIFDSQERNTLIHRRDPRARIAVFVVVTAVVILAQTWPVLLAAGGWALLMLVLAEVHPRRVLRRCVEVNLLVLVIGATLPLTVPGEPRWTLGGLTWSNAGLDLAGRIALRANIVVLGATALLVTMDPTRLAFALGRLGCPRPFVLLLLTMLRYVEVIHVEYHRLREAMSLRSFRPRPDRHTLTSYGNLVGMLLVRSCDRSTRILEAMRCRGYDGRIRRLDHLVFHRSDWFFCGIGISCAATLALLEWS